MAGLAAGPPSPYRPLPMSSVETEQQKGLPPPWDRIFSLGTRTFVWGLLLGVLYILRPFLLLIFLTFVFAYIQAHGVDGLQHRIKSRALRVAIVGLVFLGTILATVFTLAPHVERQARIFADNWQTKYLPDADKAVHEFLIANPGLARLLGRGPGSANRAEPPTPKEPRSPGEQGSTGASQPVRPAEPPPKKTSEQEEAAGQRDRAAQKKDEIEPLVTNFVKQLLGFSTDDGGAETDPTKLMNERIKTLKEIGSDVIAYVSSFLLSLLFSFLIVFDLPKIERGIRGLANTKVGFIYEEVAENIATFGKVLGRALEAQLFIAAVNMILTAVGIYLLGIENLLFLASIVFFCSFIPVAGVFISSTPICLLALQGGGFGMMLLAIGLILLIHAIETYILNPKIYGHHMRMNPVFVLIVLTVAGKLFGVWGLVLGIPIVNYFFRHAIRFPKDRPHDFDIAAA
ncbi:MAG: hypothetical protein Fur0037_12170 [Planctomycetota bacterium]